MKQSHETIMKAYNATKKFCREELRDIFKDSVEDSDELTACIGATLGTAASNIIEGELSFKLEKPAEKDDDVDDERPKKRRLGDSAEEIKELCFDLGHYVIDKINNAHLSEAEEKATVHCFVCALINTVGIEKEIIAQLLSDL